MLFYNKIMNQKLLKQNFKIPLNSFLIYDIDLKKEKKSLTFFNNQTYNQYIPLKNIPKNLNIKKKNNILTLSLIYKDLLNKLKFKNLLTYLKSSLKNLIETPFQKQLILKGLGFKAELEITTVKKLVLKIGFSHKVNILIPKNISILVNKNIITLESFNKTEIGNFAYKIKLLKFPDIYKAKGFWDKHERISLKPIKKT